LRAKNIAVLLVMALAAAPAVFADSPVNPPQRSRGAISAQNLSTGERWFQPITLVLLNASPNEAIQTLAQTGGVAITFAAGVDTRTLRPLSVTAREAPFYRVLQQVAFAEDLTVNPTPRGFTLSAAAGAGVTGGFAGQSSGGGFPPPAAAPFGGGAFGGGAFGGGAFGGPAGGSLQGIPGKSPQAAGTGGAREALPIPEAQRALPSEAPEKNVPLAMPPGLVGAAGAPGTLSVQPAERQLQYVLQYAQNPQLKLLSPERVIEGLKTTSGSLQYVAVVSEALTQLTGAENAGPALSAAVTRLRALLGQAEDLHRQACERERLQTEILVLQTHIPRAAPTLQPLLRDILQRREQDLEALQK